MCRVFAGRTCLNFCRCWFSWKLSCVLSSAISFSWPRLIVKTRQVCMEGHDFSTASSSEPSFISLSESQCECVTGCWRVQCALIPDFVPGRRALLLPWACPRCAPVLGCCLYLSWFTVRWIFIDIWWYIYPYIYVFLLSSISIIINLI